MAREEPEQRAVMGALLREWSMRARDGARSGRSVVVDEVGQRAYHQARADGHSARDAKGFAADAREYARGLIGLPTSQDRALEELAEKRGL